MACDCKIDYPKETLRALEEIKELLVELVGQNKEEYEVPCQPYEWHWDSTSPIKWDIVLLSNERRI
jgi:hypothetical protein